LVYGTVPNNSKRSLPIQQFAFPTPPKQGLVSVVIPTFNRARLLERAIQSVFDQTYPACEVIIVDDGSTDDTRAVVEAFGARVRYVVQANAGVATARNRGLSQAQGEFVALLDSDDAWLPWKLDAEVAALRRFPNARLVWTDMVAIDDMGNQIYDRFLRRMYSAYDHLDIDTILPVVASVGDLRGGLNAEIASRPVRLGDLSRSIALGNLVHTSSLLFRRELLTQIGGFDSGYRSGEDYDFHMRACAGGPVALIDEPSILYRVGAGDQLTVNTEGILELARRNLDAVENIVAPNAKRFQLSPAVVRERLSNALRWVGAAELDAGNRHAARRYLLRSLARLPRFDRRIVMLAICLLPEVATDVLRKTKRVVRAPVVQKIDAPEHIQRKA
jgi:GT2 family glycosyltransferase